MKRCKWNYLENNDIYIKYHDNEWGEPSYEDKYLYEMLVLEPFQAGLSWITILKKRENFRKALDDFNPIKIAQYDEKKIKELLENEGIIRNKTKILATIENAKTFLKIKKEFGTFSNYIWGFTDNKIIYGDFALGVTKNELSDKISKDMKKRGMKFMGSITTYSYLEAIGVMNNHTNYCFKYKR